MLRRLTYISRSLTSADPEGIPSILSSSMRMNAKANVTGMLWFDGESFAQVIEGEPDRIETTMERIHNDSRHADVEILLDRSVLSRQFGSWSMRRAGDDAASAQGTAFMIGFAMSERTVSSKRLYQIVLSAHAGEGEKQLGLPAIDEFHDKAGSSEQRSSRRTKPRCWFLIEQP